LIRWNPTIHGIPSLAALEQASQLLLSRSWTLHSSGERLLWMRLSQNPSELPVAVEGSNLRGVTLEAIRMELSGPVIGLRSTSGTGAESRSIAGSPERCRSSSSMPRAS
jgi:hypothetical protein